MRNSPAEMLIAPRLASLSALNEAKFRAMFVRLADQKDRTKPLRSKRADRDRQFPRSGTAPLRGSFTAGF